MTGDKTKRQSGGPLCDCPCVTTPWPIPIVQHVAGCEYEGVMMTDMERHMGIPPASPAKDSTR